MCETPFKDQMATTVADLKHELKKRKLPTDGLKGELESRLHAADKQVAEEAVNEIKRCKTVMTSVADEFLCPITQELPVDPAIAEDGKIYERSAIKTWLEKNQRSPSTGASMGTRLFPAVQVRSTIEHLVKGGAVDAEKAAAWTKKLEDETKVKQWKSKAEGGDAEAMYELSCAYYIGDFGLAEDDKQARAWAERAADLGHVKSMARYGYCLTDGIGGQKRSALGVYYTTQAATLGSDAATWNLGTLFADGADGLPRDNEKAKLWFTRIVDGKCTVLHGGVNAQQNFINKAKAILRGLG